VRPVCAVASVIALVGGVTLVAMRPGRYAEQGYALVSTKTTPRFFNRAEVALIRRTATTLPAGAVVLGDPSNGSAYIYSVSGRRVVFPHLTGTWGAERDYVKDHFGQLTTDPAVCHDLQQLGARYFYYDPVTYRDLNNYTGLTRGLDLRDGLTAVDSGGGATLYRITACG
jgi:hypothetical protein